MPGLHFFSLHARFRAAERGRRNPVSQQHLLVWLWHALKPSSGAIEMMQAFTTVSARDSCKSAVRVASLPQYHWSGYPRRRSLVLTSFLPALCRQTNPPPREPSPDVTEPSPLFPFSAPEPVCNAAFTPNHILHS